MATAGSMSAWAQRCAGGRCGRTAVGRAPSKITKSGAEANASGLEMRFPSEPHRNIGSSLLAGREVHHLLHQRVTRPEEQTYRTNPEK